ncbi:MAG: hypothetical protein ACOCUO_00385 [archaeon]
MSEAVELIKEQTEPEADGKQDAQAAVWTHRRRLAQDYSIERSTVDELVESGELFEWHGLLTINDDEHLSTVIANENQSQFSRVILAEKAAGAMEGSA